MRAIARPTTTALMSSQWAFLSGITRGLGKSFETRRVSIRSDLCPPVPGSFDALPGDGGAMAAKTNLTDG
jgi:hypothetical protein